MENNSNNNNNIKLNKLWLNGIVVVVILLIFFIIVGSLNDFNEIFSIIKIMDNRFLWLVLGVSFLSFVFLLIFNYIVFRVLNKEISLVDGFLI